MRSEEKRVEEMEREERTANGRKGEVERDLRRGQVERRTEERNKEERKRMGTHNVIIALKISTIKYITLANTHTDLPVDLHSIPQDFFRQTVALQLVKNQTLWRGRDTGTRIRKIGKGK